MSAPTLGRAVPCAGLAALLALGLAPLALAAPPVEPAAARIEISQIAASDPDREPDDVIAARTAAVRHTAESSLACAEIRPFYWEIGDRGRALASGASGMLFGAETAMPVASASKLVYAAWVAQERGGPLTPADVAALSLRSGRTSFRNCRRDDTVHGCAERGDNDRLDPAAVGKFWYGGGHMQVHADQVMHLGELGNVELGRLISDGLGLHTTRSDFAYTQPQLAGGLRTSPRVYGEFLRRLLDGGLALGGLLGRPAFCTNPATCPGEALRSPFPADETPRYSLGHWVEDREHGDGAFSSPGAFGFYPWIDRSRTWYGIVARAAVVGIGDPEAAPSVKSVACGRALRRAWVEKVFQE
ncbi:hypothetical protein [Derxia lacustris]|uniref:hypothetical protein n=1 Tax=Derxia lacustris TaxID=764842 RepID=UPI000A174774|nr:hypothetical protein [Derxia lacustris]